MRAERLSEFFAKYFEDARRVRAEFSQEELRKFTQELYEAWLRGSTIYIIGNGGSRSTAEHFASDLQNTTDKIGDEVPPIRAISLVENTTRLSALTNDKGWGRVYVDQLRIFFRPGDVIIAISVHGGSGQDKAGAWSQNLLVALQYAKDHGGRTLGFTGFDGGVMKTLCHVNVNAPIDSTPLTESIHVDFHHSAVEGLKLLITDWKQKQDIVPNSIATT